MDFGGDAITGAVLTLAAGGVVAGVKWAVGAKFKQLDGLPAQLGDIRLEMVRLTARMDKAESDIANDKAGRKAFAAVETQMAALASSVESLVRLVNDLATNQRQDTRDLWSAVNKVREGRDAA